METNETSLKPYCLRYKIMIDKEEWLTIETTRIVKNEIDAIKKLFQLLQRENKNECYKNFEIYSEEYTKWKKIRIKINNDSIDILYGYMINDAIFILE